MSVLISLPNKVIDECRELCDNGKKITAIKLARDKGKVIGENRSPGLKETKQAIDHFFCGYKPGCAQFVPAWDIHSLIVTGPLGERIELDVDQLQMHFLSSMHSVGLAEVSRLMELVDFIKVWTGRSPPSGEQSDA